MIGLLLILMAFSVAMKIRTAWFLTVLLLFTLVAINIFILKDQDKLTTYSLIPLFPYCPCCTAILLA